MNRVFYFLALVVLLIITSRASSLHDAPEASPLFLTGRILSSSLLVHRVVAVDFDSDHRQDNVILCFDGGVYRIESRFSSRQGKTSLPFNYCGGRGGLLPFNADGDQDQDLVLMNCDSLLPLAVWLNDGKGNFEKGDRSSCVLLLAEEISSSVSVQDDNPESPSLLNSDQEERFLFTKSRTRASTTLSCSTVMICRETGPHVIKPFSSGPLLRSPPLILAVN